MILVRNLRKEPIFAKKRFYTISAALRLFWAFLLHIGAFVFWGALRLIPGEFP